MDWKRIIILALVVCALIYVIYRVGISEILAVLPKAFVPGLLVFFLLQYANWVLRGARWRMLLKEDFSLWEGFRLIFLTIFYNQVSPIRLGDLWRVNECKLSGLGRCTASIITEKVIDVGVVLILVLASISAMGLGADSQFSQGIMGSLAMIVTAFVGLQVLKQKWFWELAGKFIKVEEGQHLHVNDFLKERRMFVKVFLMTILIWSIDLTNFWYLANLIVPVRFEFSSIALLVSALIGSSLITSVGVAQVLVLMGVLSLNIPAVDAAAVGILWGLVGVWVQIPLGFIVEMWGKKAQRQIPFKRFRRM